MKKTITYCNKCGKEFDETDVACGFHVKQRIGYGSVHDTDWLVLDLCCDCLDNLIDLCKIAPIVDGELPDPEPQAAEFIPQVYDPLKPYVVYTAADGNTDPYQIPMEV